MAIKTVLKIITTKGHGAYLLTILKCICGTLVATIILIFLLLSTPVYIYRLSVIVAAKLFRSDLGEIISGQSAGLTYDLLSEKNPRSNVNYALILEGKVTLDEIKEIVLKRWIYGNASKKFHQYPVRWLGYSFWKNALHNFNIYQHVMQLEEDRVIDEDKLEDILETLVNTGFTSNQSPWKIYLLENYQPNFTTDKHHSVLILKFHHCLADGFSMMKSFLRAFNEDFSMDKLELPKVQFPKRTFWQKISFAFTFPLNASIELAYILSHYFDENPYKVADCNKEWYQVYAKSDPIPIECIKKIKNQFGVSFTSVLVSAMSAAVSKSFEENDKLRKTKYYEKVQSMLSCCILPTSGKSRLTCTELTNNVTSAVIDLPLGIFKSPLERLEMSDKSLRKNKDSVIPIVFYYYSILLSNHLYPVTRALLSNRFIPIGLSNFASFPEKLKIANRTCAQCFAATGALEGEAGAVFTAVSHGHEVRIHASSEKSIISKADMKRLVQYATEEIRVLSHMVKAHSMQD